jgi:hypothetical protein
MVALRTITENENLDYFLTEEEKSLAAIKTGEILEIVFSHKPKNRA